MKTIFAIAVLVTSLLSGCGEKSKKDVKAANENIKEAGKDLKAAVSDVNEEAKIKASADWQKFKNESDSTIKVLDKQVKELQIKIAKANKKGKAKLESDLVKLEQELNEQRAKLVQKNAEFESDLKTFNESVAYKYESFKREFKHDDEELDAALKDLFRDNVN